MLSILRWYYMVATNSFTFLTVAYNHEKFILEHLESIRYLMNNYGDGIDVSIIINDDCSYGPISHLSITFLFKG